MKSSSICLTAFLFLAQFAVVAHATVTECPAYIPAGVVIRILPDEKLIAGSSSGPTLFTVSSDLRFFPNRPPLLARGSKVLGTIVESKEAGHIYGKARLKITLRSILTSDFCEYPIEAKIIEAGRYRVQDEVVLGRGHAQRDVVALLFPPTTIYQLVRIPSRGPKLVLNNETALNIKLLEPVSLAVTPTRVSENDQFRSQGAGVDPQDHNFSQVKTVLAQQASRLEEQRAQHLNSDVCPAADFSPALPVVRTTTIMRPVRNLTHYHVSLYLDRKQILILPPCSGPSMIATPTSEFRLDAVAGMLMTGGQKQISLKVVPSPGNRGWDIVSDDDEQVAVISK
jgi:hypothetical protein